MIIIDIVKTTILPVPVLTSEREVCKIPTDLAHFRDKNVPKTFHKPRGAIFLNTGTGTVDRTYITSTYTNCRYVINK